MINALLGVKKGMTSAYDARGRRVGATIVEVTPNVVTQIKTVDGKDGYNAVQLGIGVKKRIKKPQMGLLKKVGYKEVVRWLREIRGDTEGISAGSQIKVSDVFAKGDEVKVTGISKGRGFQGVVRRHGFAGGPKTHGQSDRLRAPGAISSGTTIGRVFKGKKMAGHMGQETVTITGLEVISVDKKNNLLTVKGGIPGVPGTLIVITKTGKIKGYTPPPEPEEEEFPESEAAESKEGTSDDQITAVSDKSASLETQPSEDVQQDTNPEEKAEGETASENKGE